MIISLHYRNVLDALVLGNGQLVNSLDFAKRQHLGNGKLLHSLDFTQLQHLGNLSDWLQI